LILEIFRDRPIEAAGTGSYLEGDHVGSAIHPDTWQKRQQALVVRGEGDGATLLVVWPEGKSFMRNPE
jgi:hypothetical protein